MRQGGEFTCPIDGDITTTSQRISDLIPVTCANPVSSSYICIQWCTFSCHHSLAHVLADIK